MGYLGRHWRGEFSLPVAFWVNNFLLQFPLGFGLGLLMGWVAAWGESLQSYAVAVLVGLGLLALVSVWGPIGAWRSATRTLNEGGSTGWALAAKLVLGLGLLFSAASFAVDIAPQLPGLVRMSLGQDPIGALEVVMAADGRSVQLSGPFGMGAAKRFERVTANQPQLRRVVLESPGGRLFEANEIAKSVRSRGLQTRATGVCASACTLVFVAGTQRGMTQRARLGFHRASTSSVNPLHDQLANRKLEAIYTEAGLPSDFIGHVMRTPSRAMWFPADDVLIAAGILALPSLRPELDPALPADAPVERYHEALTDNPLWLELDRRLPGAADLAAQRMREARQQGLALDATAQAAETVALAAVPMLLRTAGPQSLEAYLSLLAAELRERRGAGEAACQAALAGGHAVPPERLGRWLRKALLDPPELEAARVLSALEREVLQRELGANAPDRIAALAPSAPSRRIACAQAIDLLDAMARLRGPQRRLAMRLLLQTPA